MSRSKTDRRAGARCVVLALTAAIAPSACSDPVLDERVTALGPEVEGIPTGPTHRAGQPCLVCHGNSVSPDFSVAGTLYQKPYEPGVTPVGVEGAIVELTDANGARMTVGSNCVGNFYILRDTWDPAFPLRAIVNPGDPAVPQMVSKIGRDGACSSCHADPPGPSSPGHVYRDPETADAIPVPSCARD